MPPDRVGRGANVASSAPPRCRGAESNDRASTSCMMLGVVDVHHVQGVPVLLVKPNCECCDRDLDPSASDAKICSFECTWCTGCALHLGDVCPNCGGASSSALLGQQSSSRASLPRRSGLRPPALASTRRGLTPASAAGPPSRSPSGRGGRARRLTVGHRSGRGGPPLGCVATSRRSPARSVGRVIGRRDRPWWISPEGQPPRDDVATYHREVWRASAGAPSNPHGPGR